MACIHIPTSCMLELLKDDSNMILDAFRSQSNNENATSSYENTNNSNDANALISSLHKSY